MEATADSGVTMVHEAGKRYLVTAPPGATPNERQRLAEALRDFHSGDVESIVLPDGSKVDEIRDGDLIYVDTTDTASGGWAQQHRADKPEAVLHFAEAVPQRVTLRLGHVEVDIEPDEQKADGKWPVAFHKTRVRVDGKPFPCRAMTLHGDIQSPWSIAIEFFPTAVEKQQDMEVPVCSDSQPSDCSVPA